MSEQDFTCAHCGAKLDGVADFLAHRDLCPVRALGPAPALNPYAVQVGGSHYKGFPIQPARFSERNKLSFLAGCVVKRVARHNQPGGKGRQDLEKAIHEIQLMIEEHYPPDSNCQASAAGTKSGLS